jgi:hypothetical protein
MNSPDSAFNLTALGDRLFAERRLLPLADTIRRARDLHSLSADLAMALESLDALDALLKTPTASDDYAKIITESALLNNALVLYGEPQRRPPNNGVDSTCVPGSAKRRR